MHTLIPTGQNMPFYDTYQYTRLLVYHEPLGGLLCQISCHTITKS